MDRAAPAAAHPGAGRGLGADLAVAVAVGVAYAAASRAVVEVTSFGSSLGATFWPGAGITAAALLRSPLRRWPLVLLAVGIAEVAVDLHAGFGASLGVAWAVANTAEAAVGAGIVLCCRRSRPDLGRVRDVLRFVGGSVLAGPVVGAALGTAAGVVLAGDAWFPRLGRWYVGDAIGVLVVAPALLQVRWRRPRVDRALLAAAAPAAAAAALVAPWPFASRAGLPYLVLPVLLVLALRAGAAGTAWGVLAVGVATEVVTATGRGPFADITVGGGLVAAQLFLAGSACTAIVAAALAEDLVSREVLEASLRQQALHDSLTGLPNRRLVVDRLAHVIAGLARHDRRVVAVLFVDLDGLKVVNDRLGHAAGDALLAEAARRLEASVRPGDTVARIGGDEFVVVAEVTGPLEAAELAGRLDTVLRAPVDLAGEHLPAGASIGVAVAAAPGIDADELLDQADQAMYQAKRRRRSPGLVDLRGLGADPPPGAMLSP